MERFSASFVTLTLTLTLMGKMVRITLEITAQNIHILIMEVVTHSVNMVWNATIEAIIIERNIHIRNDQVDPLV